MLAKAFQQLGKIDDQLKTLEMAKAKAPKNHHIELALGSTYKALRRDPDAIAAFRRCIKIAPQFLSAYEELPLTVDKNRFFYQGEMIYDNPAEENNPAYLLTRDGLVQLVFLKDVEPSHSL